MSRLSTKKIRNWVTILMLVIFVTSIAGWFIGRDRLPSKIRIATGKSGGLYYKVGTAIEQSLRRETNRPVLVEATLGSEENFERLTGHESDLAIVQGGAVPIEQLSVVTPLFLEFVFVIVRKGSNIETVSDLVGKNIALGQKGSGTRNSALQVLEHFGITPHDFGANDAYFKTLMEDPSIDAAIVTAGIEHPDLREVLASNQFELVPIRSAPAIEMMHPFLRSVQIPQGLFAAQPPLPAEPIPTIATTAYLVARNDAPDHFVQAALTSIHEESLRLRVPTLIPRQQAPEWISTRLHPIAKRYFNPTDNIGMMANVMESLAATKELLFALGAGVYLLWIRWRGLKEKETQELLSQQKEHLDRFLEETLRIEEAQLQIEESEQLRACLGEVIRIKLRALHEFTEEELRGDQSFSIFLDQCASLIGNIQRKIMSETSK